MYPVVDALNGLTARLDLAEAKSLDLLGGLRDGREEPMPSSVRFLDTTAGNWFTCFPVQLLKFLWQFRALFHSAGPLAACNVFSSLLERQKGRSLPRC